MKIDFPVFSKKIYSTKDQISEWICSFQDNFETPDLYFFIPTHTNTESLVSYFFVSQNEEQLRAENIGFDNRGKKHGLLTIRVEDSSCLCLEGSCESANYSSFPWERLLDELDNTFPIPFIDKEEKNTSILGNSKKDTSYFEGLPLDLISENLEDYPILLDENQIKKIFKHYRYATMHRIITSIKPAFKHYQNSDSSNIKKFTQFSSGVIGFEANYAPETTGRYLKVLQKLGAEKVDGIPIPHRISESIKSIKSNKSK